MPKMRGQNEPGRVSARKHTHIAIVKGLKSAIAWIRFQCSCTAPNLLRKRGLVEYLCISHVDFHLERLAFFQQCIPLVFQRLVRGLRKSFATVQAIHFLAQRIKTLQLAPCSSRRNRSNVSCEMAASSNALNCSLIDAESASLLAL